MMKSPSSNNKREGTKYEREVVRLLSQKGYWAHRLHEDETGAQPFDVIAVKDGIALAIDCKVLDEKERWFRFTRLEDNQVLAFEKWLACNNTMPLVFVKYQGDTYMIEYKRLKEEQKVDMYYEVEDRKRHTDN